MTNILKLAGAVIAGVVIGMVASATIAPEKGLAGVYNQVTNYFQQGATIIGDLNLGGALTQGSTGTFATGTTTLAIIANPYTSTSTVSIVVKGTGTIATTTNLYVGTTTSATPSGITGYGAGDYKVSPSLINLASIPTSTPVYSASPSLNSFRVAPQGTTFENIIVGPSESVAIFASSTFQAPTNYSLPGSYVLRWRN